MFYKWFWFLLLLVGFSFVELEASPKENKTQATMDHVASFFSIGAYASADSLLKTCDSLRSDYAQWKAKIQFALFLKNHPVTEAPTWMAAFNSNEDTYWPSISPDHSFFATTVSNFKGQSFSDSQEDIHFYCNDSINGWIPDGTMNDRVNTPFNEGSVSFSADGNYLFFVASDRSDGLGSCDIYYLIRHGKSWSRPIHPEAPLNTRFWESNPSLSSDGKVLYFCSNRPSGMGGMDIWTCRVERQTDGTLLFYRPENLGRPVNTPQNETSPFIHPDNQTLYFSSNGYPGLGGQDVFMSHKNPSGQWSEPKNLGYPINSYADDQGFSTDAQGTVGYFSSNRLHDGRTLQQIYRVVLPQVDRPHPMVCKSGKINPAMLQIPTPVYVQVINLSNDQVIFSTIADRSSGQFTVCYPDSDHYALSVVKEGYLFHFSTLVDSLPLGVISLAKIAPGEKITLRNIYFDFNSAQIQHSSEAELNQLILFLKSYPELHLLIAGHTDSIGSSSYNLTLSTERANAVVSYLVVHGIDPHRLEAKGFGDTNPVADNRTEKGRAMNRRTEAIIIDQKENISNK